MRDVHSNRTELILGNDVPGKRLITGVAATHYRIQGIVDLTDVDWTSTGVRGWGAVDAQRPAKQGAEIAVQESRSGNRGSVGRECELPIVETLVRPKEERVVFPDRSAETGTVVYKTIPLPRDVEVIVIPGIRVQRLVLQEAVGAAVEPVRSGLHFQHDRAAAGRSPFRGHPADLHVHLLHCFHADVLDEPLQSRSGIHTVHHHVLGDVLRSGDVSAVIAALRGRNVRIDEARYVPPYTRGVDIQRQVLHRVGSHDRANVSGLRFQHHGCRGNLHQFRDCSGHHLDVQLSHLCGGECQTGTKHFLEAVLLVLDRIRSHRQCRDAVDPGLVGLAHEACSSPPVGHGHVHTDNDGSGWICDGTGDGCLVNLGPEEPGEEKREDGILCPSSQFAYDRHGSLTLMRAMHR